MTRLELRLSHPYISEPLPFGAVAKVRWVGRVDGTPPQSWWTAEKALGAGNTAATAFELPDGGYYSVEVARPRGNTIFAEYRVESGQTHYEEIDLGASPHEYLSWDQLVGIVPRKLDVETPAVLHALPSFEISPVVRAFRRWSGEPLDRPMLAAAYMDPPWRVGDASPQDGWLQSAAYPMHWIGYEDDGRFVTWWFPPLDDEHRYRVVQRIKDPDRNRPELHMAPIWIFVAVDGVLDLVVLPWAWWLASSDARVQHPIQILHDRMSRGSSGRGGRGRTTVSIRDERWFPLLEFMASGRLGEASSIIDAVVKDDELVDALRVKRKGPLLAAAAAIILIARTTSAEWQEWDPWLDNLADWFPGIPDGTAILGCRRLQQARSFEERRTAFAHLRESFHRGIPFMSPTIRMLSLAMAQLGDEFETAEYIRNAIAPVAARVDPDQPFTVIRL
jgi:hypothetical protein